MENIEFIAGGISVDDRGQLIYANEFQLDRYKRFYAVSNHRTEFVRAWHGHKHEAKAVFVMSGSAVVAAVEVDDWDNPSKDLPVTRHLLSSKQPGVLLIPAGFANGFMTLEAQTVVCFFSSSTLEESMGDDIRFPHDYWNPWQIEER